MKRWLALVLVVCAVACATARPPQALTSGLDLERRLAAFQDAERALCDGAAAEARIPVTICNALSESVGLTTVRHSTLAREFVAAFTAQAELARAIRTGSTTEPILQRAMVAVRALTVTGAPVRRTPTTQSYWVALDALREVIR